MSVNDFMGVGDIESIDTEALRSYIRDGVKQFVKFKTRDTGKQEMRK